MGLNRIGRRAFLLAALSLGLLSSVRAAEKVKEFDVVIVGGTPGGIMAAIGAARMDKTAVILERTTHVGGLPANGLGATDIHTRGATGGLFSEFVGRVKKHYVDTYGADSQQVKDSSDGFHFEASVAEKVFEQMIAEYPKITVLKQRQFDAKESNVAMTCVDIKKIKILNRDTNKIEEYAGKVFIDATYEGDLAAAAGAPFRTRREGKAEYNEPLAGKVYKQWGGPVKPEDWIGTGDDTIQAYNYRINLTKVESNRVPIQKPVSYNREEFVSLIDDVKTNRWTNASGKVGGEKETDGIGRIVNIVIVPNGKTDSNNQHASFISTDLPEENYPWPTADWAWRDKYAQRLRDYNLGLIWFAQNDPELPEEFRKNALKYGLAKDEYTDNGNFPRQVYVREGRRMEGEHLFTALDAIPVTKDGRPPLYKNSITASHYALDSHAHHKREPGRVHQEGFLSHPTKPYTVPYGVMLPKKVDNLLTPVPVSGTHMGFSTLRMEPCWMALGQAAGVAAAHAINGNVAVRAVHIDQVQAELLKQKAVLIYVKDVPVSDPLFEVVQYWGLRGLIPEWEANLKKPVDEETAKGWISLSSAKQAPKVEPGMTRGALLEALYKAR